MVPLYERRHRLQPEEVPEVIEGLRLRLRQHLEAKKDLLAATIAFRAFYRLIEHPHGRPDYPEPFTWGLIEAYIQNGTVIKEEAS